MVMRVLAGRGNWVILLIFIVFGVLLLILGFKKVIE